ncbi:Uncharacterised protein [Sphingobacterium multivorum]|nr:Uncharacterised protein [Sphingobacterium multivorum]
MIYENKLGRVGNYKKLQNYYFRVTGKNIVYKQ